MGVLKAIEEVKEEVNLTRRRILMAISMGSGGLVAAAVSVPIVGFLFSPMLRKYPGLWQDVGPLSQFKEGATVQVNLVTSGGLAWDGPAQRIAGWLRRNNASNFTVYSSKCTHLGCPVRWLPDPELFMCPCHGGVYFKDGDVAAGPPPQPLQQFPVRVVGDRVQVQWIDQQVHYVRNGSPSEGCPKHEPDSPPASEV
jgi:menaquinol-cytochrome c reductase iron-sulfur subunit